ncbi:MAG: flagellar protein FliS, partial [Verrucomicrobia bacterium]|nr:flagellar protein FliS [Verrucomicrobiota bacterium]
TAIHNNVSRAQAIIHELNACLNLDAGGEVAANFRQLYNYFDGRLQESNQRKRPEGIDDVLRRLGILRDAWAEMLRTKSDEIAGIETQLAMTARLRAA